MNATRRRVLSWSRRLTIRRIGVWACSAMVAAWLVPTSAAGAKEILQPNLERDKTFSESYTLIADLGDAAYVQLQLAVSNIGMSSGRGACRALVVERGKPAWTEALEVSRSDWSYEPGAKPTLRVGECSLESAEHTVLRASFDRAEMVLELDAPMRPTRPLDRRIVVGGRFYESDILIPWAAARLRMTPKGGTERILEGHGYGDHSRSTTLPGNLARRWVRFRGLSDSGSMLMLARFPTETDRVDGWLWSQDEDEPVALTSVRLTPSEGAGGQGQWLIRAETVSGAIYEIKTGEQLYRYAPVEDGGMMARMLKRVIGNPVTYTYRAVSSEETSGPGNESGIAGEVEPSSAKGAEPGDLSGIAEVTIVDE
jgi:hypothetical protein